MTATLLEARAAIDTLGCSVCGRPFAHTVVVSHGERIAHIDCWDDGRLVFGVPRTELRAVTERYRAGRMSRRDYLLWRGHADADQLVANEAATLLDLAAGCLTHGCLLVHDDDTILHKEVVPVLRVEFALRWPSLQEEMPVNWIDWIANTIRLVHLWADVAACGSCLALPPLRELVLDPSSDWEPGAAERLAAGLCDPHRHQASDGGRYKPCLLCSSGGIAYREVAA
jgi:hypothetical protein